MAECFDMNDFLAQNFFNEESAEAEMEVESETETVVETQKEETEQLESSKWDSYRINDKVKKVLSGKFPEPTHIQHAFLSALPKQAVVSSPTGSGKTLAYLIPVLSSAIHEKKLTGLIVTPTRELASQVSTVLSLFPIKTACIVGGLAIQKQERLIQSAQIIICTPGRLFEILSTNKTLLKDLQYLIFDEADRLLLDGHFSELKTLVEFLPKVGTTSTREEKPSTITTHKKAVHSTKRSKWTVEDESIDKPEKIESTSKKSELRIYLFSATLNPKAHLKKLLDLLPLYNPKFISTNQADAPVSLPSTLTHTFSLNLDKEAALYTLLQSSEKTVVFTNSIDAVSRLVRLLKLVGIKALGLHSHLTQKLRLATLEKFRVSGVLITTDVASRGLDFVIERVINYHFPKSTDTYIHRSGRTARNGSVGHCHSLIAPSELPVFRKLDVKCTQNDILFPKQTEKIIKIATEIEKREYSEGKNKREKGTLKRLAEEAELEFDDELSDEEGKPRIRNGEKSLDILKRELDDLVGR